MTDDWPEIGKIIISAIPAFLILLGVLLVLIEWPSRFWAIQYANWLVIVGAFLFVPEIVIIYHKTDDWPKMGRIVTSVVPTLLILLGVLLVLIDWPWRFEAISLGTWMVIIGGFLFVLEIVIIYYLRQQSIQS